MKIRKAIKLGRLVCKLRKVDRIMATLASPEYFLENGKSERWVCQRILWHVFRIIPNRRR